MKAAIIGAGVSGLTCGALLAQMGWDVTVYDGNGEVGGVCSLAHKGNFSWEQGQLLMGGFLPGEAEYRLLEGLGIRLPVLRADRGIEFPDFKLWRPAEYAGPDWRKKLLCRLFPAEAGNIEKWYRFEERMNRLSLGTAAGRKNAGMWLDWQLVKKYRDLSAKRLMDDFFTDEKLKAVWIGILADFCAYPSQFPALGVPGLNLETAFDDRIPLERTDGLRQIGYGYLKGGMQKLPEALAAFITSHGGTIRLSTEVQKVLIGGKAEGVRLSDGTEERCDAVIGSGGGREFFGELVGLENLDDAYRHVVETFQPMDAVFMVHLGVDYDIRQYQAADLCYYYGTYDIESAVTKVREGQYHGGRDGYLIFLASGHAPAFAPQGQQAVTIYTVAPDTLKEGSWEKDSAEYADELIALASRKLPDLKNHITERLIMTAAEYRKLAHLRHSAFGGSVPIVGQANPAHVTPVGGLYFVGQQSENMGGVGAVMEGAAATVRKILGAQLPEPC